MEWLATSIFRFCGHLAGLSEFRNADLSQARCAVKDRDAMAEAEAK